MLLETPRLLLRPWEDGDAQDLYEFAKDPQVGPIAGWPVHTSVDNSLEIIHTALAGPETYAVIPKSEGRAVGSAGIMFPGSSNLPLQAGEAEIGYWIGVPFWGQGLIPEAVEELLRRSFMDLGCRTVWCSHYAGNQKSARVQEKCGFTFHHREEARYLPLLDDTREEVVNRITKAQWLECHS